MKDASVNGDQLYRIEQVAERTGLTRRTLRYYEGIGLLPPPRRTEGNYRLYSEEDVATVEHIQRMRDALGLSLREIQTFLAADDERSTQRAIFHSDADTAQRAEALDRAEALTREQLALITQKLTQLHDLSSALNERLVRYDRLRAELSDGAGAGVA